MLMTGSRQGFGPSEAARVARAAADRKSRGETTVSLKALDMSTNWRRTVVDKDNKRRKFGKIEGKDTLLQVVAADAGTGEPGKEGSTGTGKESENQVPL